VWTVVEVCLERKKTRYKGNPSGGSEAAVMEWKGAGARAYFITAAAAEGEGSRRLLPGLGLACSVSASDGFFWWWWAFWVVYDCFFQNSIID